jgi:parvulin-like peptidyl-prolyl isomerase
MKRHSLFSLILICLLIAACNTSKEEKTTTDSTTQTTASTDASNQGEPQPGQVFQFGPPDDFAGSHILIGHKEAPLGSGPPIERTKEEALEKAKTLITNLLASPDQFETIAAGESDGPSGKDGGYLGSWQKGRMVAEFDEAIAKLEIGQITADPVETRFGYHIIRRDKVEIPRYYGLEGFIIGFKNQRMPNVDREPLAAEQLAKEVEAKLTEANFDELAVEHNDVADGVAYLASFKERDPSYPPIFEETAKSLRYGQIAGPIKLPMGYAFVRRVEVERRAGSHILVSYKGSGSSKPGITKTKEEAEAFAKDLLTQVQEDPTKFNELAKTHSDDSSAVRDGNLGEWWRGQMVPPFEKAVSALENGEIYPEVVESRFGYHIIRRNVTELERQAAAQGADSATPAE